MEELNVKSVEELFAEFDVIVSESRFSVNKETNREVELDDLPSYEDLFAEFDVICARKH